MKKRVGDMSADELWAAVVAARGERAVVEGCGGKVVGENLEVEVNELEQARAVVEKAKANPVVCDVCGEDQRELSGNIPFMSSRCAEAGIQAHGCCRCMCLLDTFYKELEQQPGLRVKVAEILEVLAK